jgi:hypothetical protein
MWRQHLDPLQPPIITADKNPLQAQDQTDSLIPLLYVQHGSLQKAIDVAARSISSSVAEFDQISSQVVNRDFDNEDMRANLKRFIDGCKYACTANLNWGYIHGSPPFPSSARPTPYSCFFRLFFFYTSYRYKARSSLKAL